MREKEIVIEVEGEITPTAAPLAIDVTHHGPANDCIVVVVCCFDFRSATAAFPSVRPSFPPPPHSARVVFPSHFCARNIDRETRGHRKKGTSICFGAS